jgi:hypothetical protein
MAMIRAAWVISIALVLTVPACTHAQDGRLQRIRDDVRSNSSDSSSSAGGDSVFGNILGSLFSTTDSDGNSLGGSLVVITALAPFYVPMGILNDRYEFRLGFAPHPYAGSYHGYQLVSPELASMFYGEAFDDVPRKSWAVRLAVEDGDDFNGINRCAGQFKLDHESRWGMMTTWNYFRERLPCGCTDQTLIGDVNLTFRFAQNEIACLYAGLGIRMLTDARQTDLGFNFTYGGDWFPMRPLVVTGVFDAGTLGSAGVVHGRATLGAIWNGWELFAGYDFLHIGSTNLQGPMAGVRFWF